jgi:hypothetical protein
MDKERLATREASATPSPSSIKPSGRCSVPRVPAARSGLPVQGCGNKLT